jgi:hypothetical protein
MILPETTLVVISKPGYPLCIPDFFAGVRVSFTQAKRLTPVHLFSASLLQEPVTCPGKE